MPLTWADLIIDSPTALDWNEVLGAWAPLLDGRIRPVFLDKLGCIYVERDTGEVVMLDVLSGEVETLAPSRDAFTKLVNNPGWQNVYLCASLIAELHAAGKKAAPEQCYSLAAHPALGGPDPRAGDKVDLQTVKPMSVRVWHSICRQILGGPP